MTIKIIRKFQSQKNGNWYFVYQISEGIFMVDKFIQVTQEGYDMYEPGDEVEVPESIL